MPKKLLEVSPEEQLEMVDKKAKKLNGKVKGEQIAIISGDNANMVNFMLLIKNLKPIDLNNITQIQRRITEYFDFCVQYDKKPTYQGLALALKTNIRTLNRWITGETYKPDSIVNEIELTKTGLASIYEEAILDNKMFGAVGFFILKNHFGYKDTQDVVVSPNAQVEASAEDLIKEAELLNPDNDIIDVDVAESTENK